MQPSGRVRAVEVRELGERAIEQLDGAGGVPFCAHVRNRGGRIHELDDAVRAGAVHERAVGGRMLWVPDGVGWKYTKYLLGEARSGGLGIQLLDEV